MKELLGTMVSLREVGDINQAGGYDVRMEEGKPVSLAQAVSLMLARGADKVIIYREGDYAYAVGKWYGRKVLLGHEVYDPVE